ncbi:hypothetical protein S40288_07665 [Stachybotrys chartarum IBT 40288]|nr:hypothetical protein S40288_07665 [Stachybotrys chartarum IBT 40288]
MADSTQSHGVATSASLPYHEPSITQILVLASFCLSLNAINYALDRLLYCGLIGQLFIGIAWGAPGGNWLSASLQDAIVQIGYLGLILIVFEGGLSSSVKTMKANMLLSISVAVTGIAVPMGLSFALGPMVGASSIQCFAAGAALCATSLGTTFTVLSTSGLTSTRLGTVLSTAAMMDDIVGLIMLQIVSNIGQSNTNIAPTIILRPALVSLGFIVLTPLVCRYAFRPLMKSLASFKGGEHNAHLIAVMDKRQTAFVIQTAGLLSCVVAYAYAGASVLLAAYVAGVVISWWNDEWSIAESRSTAVSEARGTSNGSTTHRPVGVPAADSTSATPTPTSTVEPSSQKAAFSVYDHYYCQSIERALKPFFFASIGFSIPISKMFSGDIVWRGIIYTVLMTLGKLTCGLWLIRLPLSMGDLANKLSNFGLSACGLFVCTEWSRRGKSDPNQESPATPAAVNSNELSTLDASSVARQAEVTTSQVDLPRSRVMRQALSCDTATAENSEEQTGHTPSFNQSTEKPLSLYPAGILSFAMVSRGEIGFLISSVAETNGIFRSQSDNDDGASEIFLIVTWAIVLCTIIGPLSVGLLVKRVKKLTKGKPEVQEGGEKRNVLGVWGVQ